MHTQKINTFPSQTWSNNIIKMKMKYFKLKVYSFQYLISEENMLAINWTFDQI